MKDTSHNSDINIAITAASYSGNKGAAAMLQSSLSQLYEKYGSRLNVKLMSVYPDADIKQVPFDFVEVVPAKPERLVFFAFPMAVLYKAFGRIPGVKKLIGKNRIIGAYRDTDLVIDEAGISFFDNRGFVMNTYAATSRSPTTAPSRSARSRPTARSPSPPKTTSSTAPTTKTPTSRPTRSR